MSQKLEKVKVLGLIHKKCNKLETNLQFYFYFINGSILLVRLFDWLAYSPSFLHSNGSLLGHFSYFHFHFNSKSLYWFLDRKRKIMSFQDFQNGKRPSSSSSTSRSPSQAVAAGIFQINTAVAGFRRLVDAIGTDKDTPEHRHKLSVFLFCVNRFLCKSMY